MELLEQVKILSGESNEALINLLINKTQTELEILISKTYDIEWDNVCGDMVVFKLNRRHNEGLSSMSVNGLSEVYLETYPRYIIKQINKLKGIVRFY